jgi:hypothetical protein
MFKPVMPTKPIKRIIFSLYEDMTLNQIRNRLLEEVSLKGISPEAVNTAVIAHQKARYGDDSAVVVKVITLSDEIAYENKVMEYHAKEAEYQDWWAKNKDKVLNVRKDREGRAKQARIVELEKEIERLKNG